MSVSTAKPQGLNPIASLQFIEKNIFQKYATSFHFYQVKPINEILVGNYDSSTCIHLNDLRILIDDTEFLRRVYFFRTLTGRPEIDHRIKLCADYYSKVLPIAHHYPMMVVTDTRSLFMRRNHRLKKMQAGEGSSDQTEQKAGSLLELHQPPSCDFLEDLDRSSVEEDNGDSASEEGYGSSVHDVFEECPGKDQMVLLDLKGIEEASVSHLITDLTAKCQSEDEEPTAPSAVGISKPFTLINNKIFDNSSISVAPLPQGIQLQKKKSAASKYFDLLHQNRGYILSGLISNFQNSAEQLKRAVPSIEVQMEKTELQSRRRRIRQKAEQLLRRAKSDIEEGNILRQ